MKYTKNINPCNVAVIQKTYFKNSNDLKKADASPNNQLIPSKKKRKKMTRRRLSKNFLVLFFLGKCESANMLQRTLAKTNILMVKITPIGKNIATYNPSS